jgi:4-amino-4-deoxy-L-arabinose transferase-like glycosyltransferase
MPESRTKATARELLTSFAGGLPIVFALLLVMLALRVWNLDIQDAYIDEGFHIWRAMDIWELDENPGRFAHGKLLLYYWLAPAAHFSSPDMLLWTCRLALALFSMVTGAAIYVIGRKLSDHATGVVALAIYAVLPIAVYYERMAMAGPLASGLTALLILALLTTVRRPTWKGAVVVGILAAAATMAKMTVALVILLPALVAIDLFGWRRGDLSSQVGTCLRRYVGWLLVISLLFAFLWSPIVVPAYLASGSEAPFVFINTDNLIGEKGDSTRPTISRVAEYTSYLFPLIADFTSAGFLIAGIAAFFFGLLWRGIDGRRSRGVLILVQWIAVIAFPTWLLAAIKTARYFVPVLPPLCLLMALVITVAWRRTRRPIPVRAGIVVASVAWLGFHTFPFLATALTDPYELPFSGMNYTENTAGFFQSDEAVRDAAAVLNEIAPERILATWSLCHLVFFHLDQTPVCLTKPGILTEFWNAVDELPEGESLYVAFADYRPFYEEFESIEYEVVASFDRKRIDRPVRVIRFFRGDG